jgi:hypothetical protein
LAKLDGMVPPRATSKSGGYHRPNEAGPAAAVADRIGRPARSFGAVVEHGGARPSLDRQDRVDELFACCGAHRRRWLSLALSATHPAPPDLAVHRRILGQEVQFGCEFNGIVCASVDLDRPNPSADPALAQYAKQFVDTLPFADLKSTTHDVRKTIYLLLPLGGAGIGRVAQSLGFNVRTLQRRQAARAIS